MIRVILYLVDKRFVPMFISIKPFVNQAYVRSLRRLELYNSKLTNYDIIGGKVTLVPIDSISLKRNNSVCVRIDCMLFYL